MNMQKKLLLIPLMFVFLAVAVQAASVTTSLFYDETTSNTLTITQGQQAHIIISADSIFEPSMTLRVDLINSQGNIVNNLLNVYTTFDSYFLTVGPLAYLGPGNYTIVSTVTAASGQSDTDVLFLEVLPQTSGNHSPIITSSPVTQINEGANYVYDVNATDADGDTLTYSLTQAPSWLSINSQTGLITGTAPSVTSDTQFTVKIVVSDGHTIYGQTFVLTVKNIVTANNPPVANSQSITTNKNTPVSIMLTASDTDNDALTFSIVSNPSHGTLSNFNSTSGMVTYTPNVNHTGSDSFTFKVNDGTADSNVATVSITVNPVGVNNPPIITSTPVTQVDEGANYVYDVNATDADGDTLTYSLTQAPSWLSINSATGLITGTAQNVNADTPFNVTITVSDGTASVTQSYVLTVKNVPSNGNGGGRATSSGSEIRIIPSSEFEEQKYIDQFVPKTTAEEEIPQAEKRNLFTLLFILFALLCLALLLILVFFLISRRR
ncbi:MAG: putative Ig domain-containing protein [Nanoarchaeota archaeon]|nr:putative Ig domain-containing protein [Nanoarchaeota archaeon]